MTFGYKILGQVAPANTSNANLYTVAANRETIISSIAIANVTAVDTVYHIFVRAAGAAAADSNKLVGGALAVKNTTTSIGIGITLAPTDIITVQSGAANALTFHAFGTERVL